MAGEPYLRTKVDGRLVRCHRVVWEEANGPLPAGAIVHHRNGDGLDNRLENLEAMPQAEHMRRHRPRRTYPVRMLVNCLGCGVPLSQNAAYYGHKRCRSCARREVWRRRQCAR